MVKRVEYDFLKPYKAIIRNKLRAFKDTHDRGCLGELAKTLRLDQSRLSNFISNDSGIDLTPTYAYAFIKGGFITVDELLRGKDLFKMSDSEREFWADAKTLEDRELMKICQTDPELIDIIKKIKRKGKDAKPVLMSVFLSDES